MVGEQVRHAVIGCTHGNPLPTGQIVLHGHPAHLQLCVLKNRINFKPFLNSSKITMDGFALIFLNHIFLYSVTHIDKYPINH